MKRKPIVLYHKNCTDGFGAAWCFWNEYKDSFDYQAVSYNEAPPDVTDRIVYLVDFSYPKAVLEEMLKTAEFITVIDHHKTALDWLKDFEHSKLTTFASLEQSGAMLAWFYIYGKTPPPALLKYIEDRDLWKFSLPCTREIMSWMFSWDYNFPLYDKLMSYTEEWLLKHAVAQGIGIERAYQRNLKEMIRTSRRQMVIGGYLVNVANVSPMFASDGGSNLTEENNFGATYYDNEYGRMFSLRTDRNDFDVSAVAQMYGGGGHRKAAGFKVARDHVLAMK